MASWRKQLLGRPVLIASHAGPAHRGRVGAVVDLRGTTATVDLSTERYVERVEVDLRGLRLIRRTKPSSSVMPARYPEQTNVAFTGKELHGKPDIARVLHEFEGNMLSARAVAVDLVGKRAALPEYPTARAVSAPSGGTAGAGPTPGAEAAA